MLERLEALIGELRVRRDAKGLQNLVAVIEDVPTMGGIPIGTIGLLLREMFAVYDDHPQLLNGYPVPFLFKMYDFSLEGLEKSESYLSGASPFPRKYDERRVTNLSAHFAENAGQAAKRIYFELKRLFEAGDQNIKPEDGMGWVPAWHWYSRMAAEALCGLSEEMQAAHCYFEAGNAALVKFKAGDVMYTEKALECYAASVKLMETDRRECIREKIREARNHISFLKQGGTAIKEASANR